MRNSSDRNTRRGGRSGGVNPHKDHEHTASMNTRLGIAPLSEEVERCRGGAERQGERWDLRQWVRDFLKGVGLFKLVQQILYRPAVQRISDNLVGQRKRRADQP